MATPSSTAALAVASPPHADENATMLESPHVQVDISLARIRANVERIGHAVGVAVLAVIKSDAYGLGAARVAPAIADLVDGWCLFSLVEAEKAKLWELTGKPSITLGPPSSTNPQDYLRQHTRPAVSSLQQARVLAAARPILCVDTGMQRFACPADQAAELLDATGIDQAFTHATRLEHVQQLKQAVGNRPVQLHAAASSLLDQPQARLGAVRPGLAIYQGALRVRTPLVEVHTSAGPVGYSGFSAKRHGVILCGYSNGLGKGPTLINGQLRQIMEVGMQSAYVELGPNDQTGDEVLLLGDSLDTAQVAAAWGATPHQVLMRLSAAGIRNYPQQ